MNNEDKNMNPTYFTPPCQQSYYHPFMQVPDQSGIEIPSPYNISPSPNLATSNMFGASQPQDNPVIL